MTENTFTFLATLRYAQLFDPSLESSNGRRENPRFQVACFTDDATLKAAPDWAPIGEIGRNSLGYPAGQNYIRAHSAVRAPVFGIPADVWERARRCNITPDWLITGRLATVALGRYVKSDRGVTGTLLCVDLSPTTEWEFPNIGTIIEQFNRRKA